VSFVALFFELSTSTLVVTLNKFLFSINFILSIFFVYSMYSFYSSASIYHQSSHVSQNMKNRLKWLKNQINKQRTITLEIILRMKTRITELKTRLDKMNQLKEWLTFFKNISPGSMSIGRWPTIYRIKSLLTTDYLLMIKLCFFLRFKFSLRGGGGTQYEITDYELIQYEWITQIGRIDVLS
jgi:hypothetical protein